MQKRYFFNNQIRAEELRVIDENGQNLGVMSTKAALEHAYEKGLDVVEITPDANPPVAKIVSFDKFRYEKTKEEKKNKKKSQELKHIRISARSADNDLNTQIKKIEKFLEKGDRVEIIMRLRGRERGNKDWARERMEHFLSMIESEYKITAPQKFGGQGMSMQIAPK